MNKLHAESTETHDRRLWRRKNEETVMKLKSLSLALALTAASAATAFAAGTDITATDTVTIAPAVTEMAAADTAAPAAPLEFMGVRIGNPIDPSTWWDGAAEHADHAAMEPIEINPVDPEFWMAFIDPQKHSRVHATFTNPATMAQFLKADTYTAMMDMGTMMKWMDMDSYAPMYDPQTYAYWKQPGAYGHMLNLDN